MSENELAVKVSASSLIPANIANKGELVDVSDIATSVAFLPYIQLMGSNSSIVKQGKFPIGHFALCAGDEITDIGDNFIALLVKYRAKAMVWGEEVEVTFDKADPLFRAVVDRVKSGESEGLGYGVEYLLWLPDQAVFAQYFLGNETGRRETANFHVHLGGVIRVRSHLIEAKKFSWHGPRVTGYAGDIKLPDWNASEGIIDNFVNPPKKEVAEEAEGTSDRD
jgi:hypothetical protein